MDVKKNVFHVDESYDVCMQHHACIVTCVSTENTVFHIGLKMGEIVHKQAKKLMLA